MYELSLIVSSPSFSSLDTGRYPCYIFYMEIDQSKIADLLESSKEIVINEKHLLRFMGEVNRLMEMCGYTIETTAEKNDKPVIQFLLICSMFINLLSKETAEKFKKLTGLNLPDEYYKIGKDALC